ncbi:MAG TPA: hypothetical protein VGK42_10345 [Candidatus Dormibacteraeota bacterium]
MNALAAVVEPILAPLGFVRFATVLNRRLGDGFVQVCEIQPSKWIKDQWAFIDLGVYNSEVASVLNWSMPDGVVQWGDCEVRDRLRRRNKSEEWPLRSADDELVMQTTTAGIHFFRRFESANQIVDAWSKGTLGSVTVNLVVIVVLAHKIGNRALAERLLADEWRSSQGHPALAAIEGLAHRLGITLPQE